MILWGDKICIFCGTQAGMLTGAKRSKCTLCKNCNSEFTPWLNESNCNSRDKIIEYLNYRKENKQKLGKFDTTRHFGYYDSICIDEDECEFYIKPYGKKLSSYTADIINCICITEINLIIDEHYETAEADGAIEKLASMVNPRYLFTYNLSLNIKIKHPWINEFTIKLNKDTIQVKTSAKRGTTPISPRAQDPTFKKYEDLGNDIKTALEVLRKNARQKLNAPVTSPICARCGAPISSNHSKCCDYCGCILC